MPKLLPFIVMLLSFAGAFAQTQSDNGSKPLTRLPEGVVNAEIPLLGARTLKLSEYSGKVIVLNMFATWCIPCRVESPDLAKLHQEFEKRGVVVIELSTEDPKASEQVVREWVWNFRLPYPVGWAPRDLTLTLMQGRTAIPQAFVIARDGRISRRFIGYNSDTTLNQLREAVEEALK